MIPYPFSIHPHNCVLIDALFEPQVKWIYIMNNRDCETGLMVFGYPERTYGYDVFTVITAEDVPDVIAQAEARGFVLNRIDTRWDSEHPESSADCLLYGIPGAKHWNEFPENLVAVNQVIE